MFNHNLEDQIEANEKRINELSIEVESLERQFNEMVAELKLDMVEIRNRHENQENFDDESWKYIENFKKELNEKLDAITVSFSTPKKSKGSYESLSSLKPHWIPVR